MKISSKLKIIFIVIGLFFSINFISAVLIDSVEIKNFYPGESANLKIEVKNTLEYDIEEVSLILDLEETPFTTMGGSEDSEKKIDEDEKEVFNFQLKAPSEIKPGDYNIPYEIKYLNEEEESQKKEGTFGITVGAKTELGYTLETENNIVGQKGTISLKIVNSGLGDIGFMNIKIISSKGFEILDSLEEYVGTIDSDDFETANFDVFFDESGEGKIEVLIVYKDFNNQENRETITLPFKIYTKKQAEDLGLLENPNYFIWIVAAITIGIWFIFRSLRKKQKRKDKLSS
jgi:hypothetical protein